MQLDAGAELALPPQHAGRGIYVVEGAVRWGDVDIAVTQMAAQAGRWRPWCVQARPVG